MQPCGKMTGDGFFHAHGFRFRGIGGGYRQSRTNGAGCAGSSGGIIIDTSAVSGASQICFFNLSIRGNAFQASRALLQ